MASKKAAPTDDELLAQLDNLGSSKSKPTARPPKTTITTKATKQTQPAPSASAEDDLLAELGNLAQRPASRPGTPSLKPGPTGPTAPRSPIRSAVGTPPPTSTPTVGRTSEDKNSSTGQRKSGDSSRSFHQSFTPATTTTEESPEPEPQPAAKSGGSWWGGFLSTATAAVTQAQAKVKEIQQTEEAQKYLDQVRGNVGVLKGFGGELRSMAIPTFQNILQTIAPPISSHERLQIHITHDLTNYPTLDPLIYSVFSRVMSQVEGGDLMVIQKGQEASPKRSSQETARPVGSWHDGPWWRSGERRSVNAVRGSVEGSKLVRASAEAYAHEYFSGKGGVEEVAKKATETLSESNPTRDSQIFLAVQAISQEAVKGLFEAGPSSEKDDGQVQEGQDGGKDEILFAVYLHDPIHGIAFAALSQTIPGQWIEWLDAPSGGEGTLPESIEEIVASGGIDPREWVSEWIEEVLSLVVGVVAQRYVARRMGIGEGGVKRGKLRADPSQEAMINSGGGEAARAMGGL